MLFSLLLATSLVLAPVPQDVPVSFDEAVAAASEGRDTEALLGFQRLASLDPDDLEARMWIARLHARMGNLELAEPVYRGVLLEDPGNVEAMLGVATALLARDEQDQAIEVLEVAEELEPENDEVLAALGRAYRQSGRTARAIVYFERAVAIAPTQQYRLSLEGLRLSYLHRVETRGASEQFDSGPDSRIGDIAVNVRLTDRWRVFGRGQVQRKFGVSEQLGGGGAEWRWKPTTTLRGHVLVGPDNTVVPEGDYMGEVQYAYRDATWTGGVRYFDFTGARTTVFSPAVAWTPEGRRIAFGLRYAMAWTEANTLRRAATSHSAHLTGAYRLRSRLWLQAGYAAGVEDFEIFSIDRIGDFRANTLSGGLRIDLPTLTSIVANYEKQWRRGPVDMSRVALALQQRF